MSTEIPDVTHILIPPGMDPEDAVLCDLMTPRRFAPPNEEWLGRLLDLRDRYARISARWLVNGSADHARVYARLYATAEILVGCELEL